VDTPYSLLVMTLHEHNSVSFLVRKSNLPFISAFQPISDRLDTIMLQRKETKTTLILTYFPTTSYPDEEVDHLYDEIQTILDNIPQRDLVFFLGEFNDRVGELNSSYPKNVKITTVVNASPTFVLQIIFMQQILF